MNKFLKDFIYFFLIILAIDVPWIYNVMSKYYKKIFRNNIEIKLNYYLATTVYIIMTIGYVFFVFNNNNSVNKYYLSFFYGLVLYGTYAFTLAAMFKTFPFEIALLETIWGGTLFTLSLLIYNLIH